MEAQSTPQPYKALLQRFSIYMLVYKALLEAHYRSRFKRGVTTIDNDHQLKIWRPDTEPPGFQLIIKACSYDISRITVQFRSNDRDLVITVLEYCLATYEVATTTVSSYGVEFTYRAFGSTEEAARHYFTLEPPPWIG